MSVKIRPALAVIVLLCATVAAAQTQNPPKATAAPKEKTFNLSTSQVVEEKTEQEVKKPVYVPAIEPGKLEVTLTLGFMGLNKTLMEHDQIVYKTTTEAFYYADVALKASSAFTPVFHATYNLKPWFALEGQVSMTFGEYQATLANNRSVSPEGGAVDLTPDVGKFDAERRSLVAAIGDIDAVIYPLNIGGSGRGRWHPYLMGGVGRARYSLDSNYTDDAASAFDANFGGGLRLIADDLVSIRMEVAQHIHTIEFKPAQYFDVRNDGTVKVPVYEFDSAGQYTKVNSYSSHSLGSLVWSVGITASF